MGEEGLEGGAHHVELVAVAVGFGGAVGNAKKGQYFADEGVSVESTLGVDRVEVDPARVVFAHQIPRQAGPIVPVHEKDVALAHARRGAGSLNGGRGLGNPKTSTTIGIATHHQGTIPQHCSTPLHLLNTIDPNHHVMPNSDVCVCVLASCQSRSITS